LRRESLQDGVRVALTVITAVEETELLLTVRWIVSGIDIEPALGGLAWGLVAYGLNYIFLYGAILIGYLVAAAVLRGTGKVTRFGQIIIPVLTIASVLFGDAIFYTLIIMKQEHVAFSGKLLNAVVLHLWEIEIQDSGVLSLLFGLVGAGYALYSARKPKFQAVFQPLGAPNA